MTASDRSATAERRVVADQDAWCATRTALNAHRPELTRLAAQLYPPDWRVADADLLAAPGWIPPTPIPLARVALSYREDVPPPAVTGAEPVAEETRPLADVDRRYPRYSEAMADLARPRLFDDRESYRLVHVDLDPARPRLELGRTSYFEQLDVVEPLAHELARANRGPDGGTGRPNWARVPFRRLLGDPFDLARRALLPSIDTLTIRWDRRQDSRTFLLHHRDPQKVAVAGGTTHVMPCGVFQPSSSDPAARVADFDLWRCLMREYAEEFLGHTEYGADGRLVDYTDEPFRSLDEAYRAGRLRVFVLGLALDALTLVGEILTVCVLDADVYDDVFADVAAANAEGRSESALPFAQDVMDRQLGEGRMAPGGAGCLRLAWEHRAILFEPGGPDGRVSRPGR
ncbi:XRE family transcriptional regulator [Cryptosporangium minutisporangium]|uniref:Transcriptional regulator n=1 Tax=Cryptosporangium minutisporangium TaxID=113569 RepID=A0ABP6STB9_9ACTN